MRTYVVREIRRGSMSGNNVGRCYVVELKENLPNEGFRYVPVGFTNGSFYFETIEDAMKAYEKDIKPHVCSRLLLCDCIQRTYKRIY